MKVFSYLFIVLIFVFASSAFARIKVYPHETQPLQPQQPPPQSQARIQTPTNPAPEFKRDRFELIETDTPECDARLRAIAPVQVQTPAESVQKTEEHRDRFSLIELE
jgi:hypothetical protein